jgi:hypothetical protein
MSNYVDIKTSVSDIIGLANQLHGQGQTMVDQAKPLVETIKHREVDGRALPRGDEFVEQFLEKYHHTPDGGHGQTANLAVMNSAVGMGEALKGLADYVTNAMWSYQGQDVDNGTEIGKTPTNAGTAWSATRA